MVEDIVHTLFPEPRGHHIDVIRGITAVNHMKTSFLENLAGQTVFRPEGRQIFAGVAYCSVPFGREVMAIDMHPLHQFVILVIPLSFGTDYGDGIAVGGKSSGLLPYTRIERYGEVFNYNQYFTIH